MNGLFALLFKHNPFQVLFKSLVRNVSLRRLIPLFDQAASSLSLINFRGLIQSLTPNARRELDTVLQAFNQQTVITEVWSRLSVAERKRFKLSTDLKLSLQSLGFKFRKALSPDEPELYGEPHGTDVAGAKRPVLFMNKWFNVVSIAFQKSMFIPAAHYSAKGSFDESSIFGTAVIVFKSSPKQYSYFNITYKTWREAAGQIGPVDGHGFWSYFLNQTDIIRHGRGYLTTGAIIRSHAKLQTKINNMRGRYSVYQKSARHLKPLSAYRIKRVNRVLAKQAKRK